MKKVIKKSTKKCIGLFDHIKHVNKIQDPDYFKKLSDSDKKTWDNWMTLRALSYNSDYTDIINEIQKYYALSPEIMYQLLIGIFPTNNGFYPFIKSKSEQQFNKELLDIIRNHFQISSVEAYEYLTVFFLSDENKKEVIKILSLYGKEEKEIQKLIKT